MNDGATRRGSRLRCGGVQLDVARRRSAGLRRKRRDDRRIAGLAGEVAGVALVHHDGVGAADDGLAVAGRIPDDAHAAAGSRCRSS